MVNTLRCLFVRWAVRGFALACVVAAAGCAHVAPGANGGTLDRERLSNAVSLDDVSEVRALVEARVISVNDMVPGVGYSTTPLITVAARHAALNVLRYLIAAKADLDARTPDNDTALMLAAFFAHEDRDRGSVSHERYDQAVRLLVEAGAELENYGNSYTPLAYAAYSGRDSTVRYLIEKGARVNADAQGRMISVNTPLMMATIQGHQNAARQLLRAGADAGVRVEGGMSAGDFAQKYKQTHLMQMLRCAESLRPGESFSKRCE
ncbi:MAG: ankyrin repeat domain-containing protein [Burkholderiales bacterium]